MQLEELTPGTECAWLDAKLVVEFSNGFGAASHLLVQPLGNRLVDVDPHVTNMLAEADQGSMSCRARAKNIHKLLQLLQLLLHAGLIVGTPEILHDSSQAEAFAEHTSK